MKIDRKLIAHLEKLSRIELPEGSVEKIAAQLDRIVAYVEQLQKVDTSGVSPTRFAVSVGQEHMRADDVKAGLGRDEVLSQAPDAEQGLFRVPRIIGKGEE